MKMGRATDKSQTITKKNGTVIAALKTLALAGSVFPPAACVGDMGGSTTPASKFGDVWPSAAHGASVAFPNTPDGVRCRHYGLAVEAAKAGLGAVNLPGFVGSAA